MKTTKETKEIREIIENIDNLIRTIKSVYSKKEIDLLSEEKLMEMIVFAVTNENTVENSNVNYKYIRQQLLFNY